MQAQRGPLRGAGGPFQPDFATGVEALQLPALGQQPRRQPRRPIALRQAEIEAGRGLPPVLGQPLSAQLGGQRLAVGQAQAGVETLRRRRAVEIEVDVADTERGLLPGLDAQPRIQHHHPAQLGPPRQPRRRIERSRCRRGAQALELPLPVGLLAQAQLQALQFDPGDPQAAAAQAGPQVGHQAQLVEMHGLVAVAQFDVAQQQQRREAAPAAFQRTEVQRLAERGAGAALQFGAVFADQRHQCTTEADPGGGQQQAQRQQREQAAQQAFGPAQGRCVSCLQSGTTS